MFLAKRPPLPESMPTAPSAVKKNAAEPKTGVDPRKIRKPHVVVEDEIGRREKALAEIRVRMNGEESSDYKALEALTHEEEAINAELEKLYDEYLELESRLEE